MRARRGQAMVEYVVAFVLLCGVIGVFAYLVGATRDNVVRTESFVSSDYP